MNMKKLFMILPILIISLSVSTVSYADPEVDGDESSENLDKLVRGMAKEATKNVEKRIHETQEDVQGLKTAHGKTEKEVGSLSQELENLKKNLEANKPGSTDDQMSKNLQRGGAATLGAGGVATVAAVLSVPGALPVAVILYLCGGVSIAWGHLR